MLKEFAQGATILIDKPLHWTSFDVVNKVRWNLKRKLGVKKIKVGHAGTLDPLATGLLILCIGKNTKLIDSIMPGEKQYTGTILLGKTTPSFDLETEYNADFPTEHITAELLEEVRQSFLGEQDQVPPVFSAKQVDGKRAYDLARAGKEVELKSNRIHISDFQIDARNFPQITFNVSCSKGTYIRSIASDFGQRLNSGGTLIELRRVRSGEYQIEDAKQVDEWLEFIEKAEL
ncbi:tRNA pseudouridine(55) synthase TruB [Crocinitomicaceae bacterium CZZ-1]|uniref:tRNA pseudouridine synthase B n=1 Tax=Taishania pollutisoli TaxID=2766479 RepID=A0A8J6TXE7_9FLAO|nr:tRNA pseudouridine(55) synthase TruB [Taishania pollutisoli]MBC9812416.1 tRNA pseudouridine(55) synthase TruB [Taishania pollutisoli]